MARRAPEETRFFIGQAAPGVGHLCSLEASLIFSGGRHQGAASDFRVLAQVALSMVVPEGSDKDVLRVF